jgi:hypothetical protein
MPRFLCSSCHQVVEMAGTGRFDWCSSCGAPLTAEDRLPVTFLSNDPVSTAATATAPTPAQASGGPTGEADRAAPALAITTNPIAATSRTPKVSPSTT